MFEWVRKLFNASDSNRLGDAPVKIAQRVHQNGDPDDPITPRPLLTIDEFFDGNRVVGSIFCNLVPIPKPQEVRDILSTIASRPDVADVRIQITSFDDPSWPFSDTVWVITTASSAQVVEWFPKQVKPDDVFVGWLPNVNYEAIPVPEGMLPIACFWD